MKSLIRILAVTAAVVSLGVRADDTDDLLADLDDAGSASSSDSASETASAGDDAGEAVSDEEGEEVSDDAEGAPSKPAGKASAKIFHVLPLCRELEGAAEVQRLYGFSVFCLFRGGRISALRIYAAAYYQA